MSCTLRWAGVVACVMLLGWAASSALVAAGPSSGQATAQPASTDKSADPLTALYEESKDDEGKETILRVVAERGGERARQFLLKVSRQDPSPEVRGIAIRHIAERGETPLLIELFDAEKDREIKETILRHLAERDDEVARKKIDDVARTHSDTELREVAIRHIVERGSTTVLAELFEREKDADIKETILRHLAERDDEAARQKVLSVARNDANPDLRETAIRHLAERGQIAALIELFDLQKSVDVREAIVRHLAESSDGQATAKLLAIARSDQDPDVRNAALRALAERAAR